MNLQDKTYIVSSAVTPLGKELSMHLAEQGANVILAGLEHVELDSPLATLQERSAGDHNVGLLEQSTAHD